MRKCNKTYLHQLLWVNTLHKETAYIVCKEIEAFGYNIRDKTGALIESMIKVKCGQSLVHKEIQH